MSFKSLVKYGAIALICFLIALAGAALVDQYIINNTARVGSFAYYTLDGVEWTTDTDLNWTAVFGKLEPDMIYTIPLMVNNTSNVPITVQFITSGVPAGYEYYWTMNNTVLLAGETVTGDLTFTTPVNASGIYLWEGRLRILD